VYDAYALISYLHQVLLGQPWDVRIMVAGHTAKIADLLEVVDQVLGMEVAQMNHISSW
jgi:Tfp pilus assembly PilM family ATPase